MDEKWIGENSEMPAERAFDDPKKEAEYYAKEKDFEGNGENDEGRGAHAFDDPDKEAEYLDKSLREREAELPHNN